jgi:tetratricopeptide (TPR) repeat protein
MNTVNSYYANILNPVNQNQAGAVSNGVLNYGNYPAQSNDQFQISQNFANHQKAQQLKHQGNEHRLQGNYKKAIEFYKQSLELNPNYTDVLYNLGRTYRDNGQVDQAIKTFKKLLEIDPTDYESRTLLGEFFEDAGSIDAAMGEYQKVLQVEPNYDYARRNLYSAYVKKIAITDPQRADQIVQKTANENLQKALLLIQQQGDPQTTVNLQDLIIGFGSTEQVNKYENLAQYEHSNRRILISNKLVFADPAVIATYLVHEAVHAGDKDAITSIREEQTAFRKMTEFWIKTNNGLIDPDLTLAMNLYRQSPQLLDAKVEDLYTQRDPNIRKTSPNHGEPPLRPTIIDNIYNGLRAFLPADGLHTNPAYLRNDSQYYVPAYPPVHYGPSPFYNPFMPAPAPQFNYYSAAVPYTPENMPGYRVLEPNLCLNSPVR